MVSAMVQANKMFRRSKYVNYVIVLTIKEAGYKRVQVKFM